MNNIQKRPGRNELDSFVQKMLHITIKTVDKWFAENDN